MSIIPSCCRVALRFPALRRTRKIAIEDHRSDKTESLPAIEQRGAAAVLRPVLMPIAVAVSFP
jgi:hypothetical protein